MSKDKVFIEPGASNRTSDEDGHWKIMFRENDKVRHLNDGKDKADAANKAIRAAAKRSVPCDTRVQEARAMAPAEPAVKKNYMDVIIPRGAPKLGDFVQHRVGDELHEGTVVDHLSEQFVIEYSIMTNRVVHMNEDWKVL